jgi:AcrR family transcriptional regulator
LDREASIYDAAVRLFEERGYHATSIQDLADAVGLQKASLYHYISGKEDLLLRIVERTMAGYLADLTQAEAAPGTGAERLHALVRLHVARVCEEAATLTILLRDAHGLTGEARARAVALTDRYTDGVTRLLRQGAEDGSLRSDLDPPVAALFLLGALNWIHRWYRPGGRLSPSELADRFWALIAQGFLPPKGVP